MDIKYSGKDIKIHEWPNPCCEITSNHNTGYIHIKSREDAVALRDSLNAFLEELNDG